jgi:hypothetical protein
MQRIIFALVVLVVYSGTACADTRKLVERFEIKPLPPSLFFKLPFPMSYYIGLPWCIQGSVLIKMVRVQRRLTNGEIWKSTGGCLVPFVGGYAVERIWSKSPEWNKYPIEPYGPIDQVPVYMRR